MSSFDEYLFINSKAVTRKDGKIIYKIDYYSPFYEYVITNFISKECYDFILEQDLSFGDSIQVDFKVNPFSGKASVVQVLKI